MTPKAESIVRVARKLFADKGFEGASIREIADEANANIALISYYFGSKEGLFEAAVNACSDELEALIDQTFSGKRRPKGWHRIELLIKRLINDAVEKPDVFRLDITARLHFSRHVRPDHVRLPSTVFERRLGECIGVRQDVVGLSVSATWGICLMLATSDSARERPLDVDDAFVKLVWLFHLVGEPMSGSDEQANTKEAEKAIRPVPERRMHNIEKKKEDWID